MTVYYRTPRGGRVPLSAREKRQLLELYADHGRPVWEIAAVFGRSTGTIYRWLPLLGVLPLAERDANVVRIPRRRQRVAS